MLAAPGIGAMNAAFWSFAAEAGPDDEFSATTLDECLEAIRTAVPRKDLGYLEIEGRSFDLLLERMRGSMSTTAVRRDLLLRAGGFPHGMITAQDWAMYVNVARLTEWRFAARPPRVLPRSPRHDHANRIGGEGPHGIAGHPLLLAAERRCRRRRTARSRRIGPTTGTCSAGRCRRAGASATFAPTAKHSRSPATYCLAAAIDCVLPPRGGCSAARRPSGARWLRGACGSVVSGSATRPSELHRARTPRTRCGGNRVRRATPHGIAPP